MITNQYIADKYVGIEPTRMAAQVVSGIGFLGAGTIITTSKREIRGLTTAAGLWAAAAVGLAIGIGFYPAAVIGKIKTLEGELGNLNFMLDLKQKVNHGILISQIEEIPGITNVREVA